MKPFNRLTTAALLTALLCGGCAIWKAPCQRAIVTLEKKQGGYTVRITDQGMDGRVDSCEMLDASGKVLVRIFRDFKTGRVYCQSALPGKCVYPIERESGSRDALDVYEYILKNPIKYRYGSEAVLKLK